MNGWPPQSNGMFNPGASAASTMNPAAMYNPGQFDLNRQYQNGTPSFQPGSVVPQKRPHDMAGSPINPQAASRSQTPGFNQHFPGAPTPYQHLQQSSNNTPSPTMQSQPFSRPPTQPPPPNASPSPFPQQQQAGFGNQISPGTPQQNNPQPGMPPGQMGGYGGMGMNNMGMAGMQSAMANQMSMMNGQNAQRAYQMRLMQQQQLMRQAGMMGARPTGAQPTQMNNVGQQPGGQAPNGPSSAQNAMSLPQNQQKREGFLKTLQGFALQQGRPFNPNPIIQGRSVDLYMLWSITMSAGGSGAVDRQGHWAMIASRLGLPPAQFPTAAEELKQLYTLSISAYERMYIQAQSQRKQYAARAHAQQMAGVTAPPQTSPTRMMQPQSQPNQFNQFNQGQQGQPMPPPTPSQAHAQLPPNGMNDAAGCQCARAAPSPTVKPQRSPSIKQEAGGPVMKSEEPQSTNYVPHMRSIEYDGGYDVPALFELGNIIARGRANMPTVDEMGVIDMRAITLSLASGIHGEVRYALDALVIISRDERIHFELEKCDDLFDYIMDCAEEQVDMLSDEAAEVSDALDLPSYEDVLRGCRAEAESLQDIPAFGTLQYELDRAADRLLAITTVIRNFSFYEHNHRLLTSSTLVKWLSNCIRLLGTRNMLLRTFVNTLDFYKDIITFLSNITQSLELPGRDEALHLLHFLLAFAPQPSPDYSECDGRVRFTSFVPTVHRFLPPAVDCLAKLLARQDPNRMLYKSIFTSSSTNGPGLESSLDLLTKAFALSISVLPDRSKGNLGNTTQLRIVEARKSYLCQGMLAADILTSLVPSNESRLARSWIEAEDGWAVGLLNLAALLSVDRSQQPNPAKGQLGQDTESFKLITFRALSMMKRLAEKAGKGSIAHAVSNGMLNGDSGGAGEDNEDSHAPKWEGIPQGHAILGALMMPNTDKVALGLLCGLHEMAMQT
ncbi:ARID/BRIGHT DNA binding domain [Teratosphaeria destructans]|uniref:ARID/BRIGHT DNA binding domain n=1 Tax=Teratosphaeria destructans TaxID=418781 RepID=A0A9W7SNZ7_9PEZI|nr:ARID/BRIGHT DNA binding domain [Teratosphaeria destructans]